MQIKLNIRSLIYQKCGIGDLIVGWDELSKKFDLVRVLELFMSTSMSRLKDTNTSEIYKFEPDVVDFLKICYWYSRITTNPTIIHKLKELRTRLAKKLLYRLESGKVSLSYEGLSSDKIQSTIGDMINELGKKGTDINRKKLLLNEYFDFVSVIISELMYPSLAKDYGHRVSFVPRNQDFDFDVKIDNMPIQIKTLFSFRYFPQSSQDIDKYQTYQKEIQEIVHLYHSHLLNKSYVEQNVVDYVKNSCISQIDDALKQKAEVVILDGTKTTKGFLLNQSFTDDNTYAKFDDSLKKSMKKNSNKFVNVIFASTAYDYNYRISALAMSLPVKDGKIDEASTDNIHLL